ncbi:MAG TPA: hypothetical protein P5191_16825 [Ruminococcus sp.]|nr:hypothetical protein [Ruminococcus sp.]
MEILFIAICVLIFVGMITLDLVISKKTGPVGKHETQDTKKDDKNSTD